MEAIRIVGGARLAGSVRVPGAKNSALMLMAAALLAEGRTTLLDVPAILDVEIMSELLRRLGCDVVYDLPSGTLTVDVPAEPLHQADYDLVRRMRASINVLGPLLGRLGIAEVALPGGDNIGSRGLDIHIAGLEKLGANVQSEHGYLIASAADGLQGAALWLDFPSVGATLNLMMAATLARGTTVIENAAREPEIVDVANLLCAMGANIAGIGTATLTITGVDRLEPVTHRVIPDRIVAGTWAVAAALTRGDVTIGNAMSAHLEIALDKLAQAGADVIVEDHAVRVRMERRPVAVDVVTLPYPGFPTDLQPHFLTLNAIAEGAGMVTENLFEARFRFVQELIRMGAEVRTDGHHALVRGRDRLSGAPVEASDIRAGAALVLAGLVADGVTTVHEAQHVDRGYAHFVEDLRKLGADVTRVQVDGDDR